jgi:hypothetical protein
MFAGRFGFWPDSFIWQDEYGIEQQMMSNIIRFKYIKLNFVYPVAAMATRRVKNFPY